jgi:hypothetical protein
MGGIDEYPGDDLLGLPGEYDPTQIKNDIQSELSSEYL